MDNIDMTDKQLQKLSSMLAEELTKRIYGIANPAENEETDNDIYRIRHAISFEKRFNRLQFFPHIFRCSGAE